MVVLTADSQLTPYFSFGGKNEKNNSGFLTLTDGFNIRMCPDGGISSRKRKGCDSSKF
jgi:hypothetical protein